MRQPLFLQSATHDIVRGCVKTSQTAFGGQLPYQGSLSANYKLCATNYKVNGASHDGRNLRAIAPTFFYFDKDKVRSMRGL